MSENKGGHGNKLCDDVKQGRSIEVLEFSPSEQGIEVLEFYEPKEGIDPLYWTKPDTESQEAKQGIDVLEFAEKQIKYDETAIIRTEKNNGEQFGTANYCIVPLEKHIYLDRHGKLLKSREKIVCKIIVENSEPRDFTVFTKDIKRLTVLAGDEFSDALVYSGIPNAAKSIENEFREATKGIPIVRHFVEHGWQRIDGKIVYGHDDQCLSGNDVFQTGMRLPYYSCTREQVGNIFLSACDLYEGKGPTSVMIAFSVLGVLYEIFEEAGHAPRFVLFINGRTGSMKTTLAKILFVQLTDEAHRDTPRRVDLDTVVSFERGIISDGRDTVTLIDDYAPAKTHRQQMSNAEKLENIIRMAGDRSTKSRSNPELKNLRGESVEGVVALTGELTGKGLSSNLRCFFCGIKKEEVNIAVVTHFQKHPYLYTTLIHHFAIFVAEKWEEIVERVEGDFQKERELAGKQLGELRVIDSAVILRITYDIIGDFLQDYCRRDLLEVDHLVADMKDEILLMASLSEQMSLEETIAVRVAKIAEQLLQSRDFVMIDRRPEAKDLSRIDGFSDDSFYYLLPDNFYEKIKRVFVAGNIYLPMNLDELIKALYEEKIIIPSSNGAGKKVYYARIPIGEGKKRNFLKIRKETLQEITEE